MYGSLNPTGKPVPWQALTVDRIAPTIRAGQAMEVQEEWLSVAKAAEVAGCSEQYIRRDLLEHLVRDEGGPPSGRTSGGRLEGWLVNGRAWLVSRQSALALRSSLTSRAGLHRRAKIRASPRKCRRKKPRPRTQ